MIINPEKLRDLGVSVVVKDIDGLEVKKLNGATIEIFPAQGEIPQLLIDTIHDALRTPEYADAVVGNVVAKLQAFQLLEAIDRTSR